MLNNHTILPVELRQAQYIQKCCYCVDTTPSFLNNILKALILNSCIYGDYYYCSIIVKIIIKLLKKSKDFNTFKHVIKNIILGA